jgi:hypothetical protein
MSASSLRNLSVADTSGGNQGLLMPKLQFRFRLLFSNFGLTGSVDPLELTRQVVDCSRPNLSFAKITLPVYNSTIYMAGKHTWNTMSINIRDDAGGNVSRLVGAQLQKQLDFMEQASASAASDYKFELLLDILDGGNGTNTPIVLEQWQLYGCYLESVNYNTVNYGTSEDIKIALTVQYDNALQTQPYGLESGVGQNAGQFPRATSAGTASGIAP